ncbi:MAG: UTP--glucose-1-phosphate uridylyltransferase [bacterium]|nr:UTP--glucose-1-phosphate uridylyltransferase [bacterium]
MKSIKKAVVAVAGSGTRLLPATKAMPKEMLPIVDKPIVQLVVEELVAAGIEDIILVTKWDKKPLEDHFDYNWALMNDLEKAGKIELKESIKQIANLANFIYVRQKPQYGNGVPILSAASLIKDEPFVFCFGDDLVKSKISFTKQMIDDYEKNGKLLMAVQEVSDSEVHRYGIAELEKNSTRIKRIIEKPSPEETPSRLAEFGRMILNQDIIDELKNTPPGKGGEIWIVDAIENYIKKGGEFHVKLVEKPDEWLTTGDPLNYMKTILKYAFDRPDIGPEIKRFTEDLLNKK